MAVHLPLSEKAKAEARILMLASNNILGPKDGKTIVAPSQDMVLGNYYLTLESTSDMFLKEAEKLEANGEVYEAQKYRLYAESEGKIFGDKEQVMLAYETGRVHLQNRIAIKVSGLNKDYFEEADQNNYLITTVGKIIFNSIMPSKLPYLNEPTKDNLKDTPRKYFVAPGTDIKAYIKEQPLIKPFIKKTLSMIIDEVFNRFRTTETSIMLDKLKDYGFAYATKAAFTVSLFDIYSFDKKYEYFDAADEKIANIKKLFEAGYLTEDERYKLVIDTWDSVKNRVQSELTVERSKDTRNPLFMISDSGARGNASHFTQLSGMRGLMSNTSGKAIELPVKSSFKEGLTVSEYFISTHGARKGSTDTALKTAESGYLTRRLVDVSQDVIVTAEDCGSDHGFVVRDLGDEVATQVKLVDRLTGRFSVRDIIHPETREIIVKGGELISAINAKAIVEAGITEVEVRSLFTCECTNGVCRKCYGTNLATGMIVNVGEAVGVMAAQSIGEPGTQLTMRTFHTGGVAGSDITQGLPRVEELFEARNPKKAAVISGIDGKVISIKDEAAGELAEIVVANEFDTMTYKPIYGSKIIVKVGDELKAGVKITEGSISPKELLEVAGPEVVQNYILTEVNKIYKSQSLDISDKHIEVIVRQMLKKVLIIEAGDTDLVYGTRVDVSRFTEANKAALLSGKRPAVGRQVLLGITKASLETESFLSACSFQETTKVLADAAIRGKRDFLKGLKENVIVGKLIPAGTGLKEFGEDDVVENQEEEEEYEDYSFQDELF
jgi:DNA-directed RNA polymerase subunit beta'